jgi:hypothetical protein
MRGPALLSVLVFLLTFGPTPLRAADAPVTVRTQSGQTLRGKLLSIDTRRLTLDVNGNKMDLLLDQVLAIEFEPAPPQAAVSKAAAAVPGVTSLPPDLTVWVIDGDTRFSKGVYHTRECPYLTNHSPRPIRVRDLPPKSVADDCVKRLQTSLQDKSPTVLTDAVASSAQVPNTAPVQVARLKDLGITQRGFSALAVGMSEIEANILLGEIGTETSHVEVGTSTSSTFVWKNDDGGMIIATFSNDKLVGKSQFSLR